MLIVYSVSFSDSAGCFLEDVIFAAKAQEVEITKFAVCLNTLISVPTNVIGLANVIQTNRILFHTPNLTTMTPIVRRL